MATTNRLAVSFSNRSVTSYDKQLDKITSKELNETLNEKIDVSYAHLLDDVKHITAEERNRWNTIMSNIKLATEGVAGLMSAEDKIKLNGIANFATNYRHPSSGVIAGAYTRVTVNEQGHVIFGENPTRLNVNVDNAEKLGGNLPSYYAKADSPTFTGVVKVPDVTISGNANSPVTIKLLEDYVTKQILNKAYPIGSIYITLVNTNPSETIGGEWRRVAEGRCLVGVSAERNITLRKTGGSTTTTLNESNIPAHDHSINISGQTSGVGDHTHTARDITSYVKMNNERSNGYNMFIQYDDGERFNNRATFYHNDTTYNNTSGSGGHSHSVSVSGNTSRVGSGAPINIENPYLGVYMWERIS